MNKLKGITVLIVDNEADLREVLGSFIESLGGTVLFAENGDQGFEISQARTVNIILSDLFMAGSDGLSLLRKLRALPTKRIPLFFLTGHSEMSEQEIKALGADGILNKPFAFKELERTLYKALELTSSES